MWVLILKHIPCKKFLNNLKRKIIPFPPYNLEWESHEGEDFTKGQVFNINIVALKVLRGSTCTSY